MSYPVKYGVYVVNTDGVKYIKLLNDQQGVHHDAVPNGIHNGVPKNILSNAPCIIPCIKAFPKFIISLCLYNTYI